MLAFKKKKKHQNCRSLFAEPLGSVALSAQQEIKLDVAAIYRL